MKRRTAELARSAWPLAATAIILRAAFLLVLPATVASNDLPQWANVTAALARHENPYTTGILAWLPLWMQFLAALDSIARHTGIEFTYVLRGFLIVVDTFNIMLALILASRFTDLRTARRALLAGMAANPVELFLVCQHGNFDALVVTALLAFALALLAWDRTRDAVDWLTATAALAIGILLKTIPLLLWPLLTFRASKLSNRARALGLAILIGPAAYGLSVVYVLEPVSVSRYVLRYRSYAGWFGVTGLLQLAGLDSLSRLYVSAFPLIALATLLLVARWLWRTDPTPQQLVLLIATMLAALIAFGPGYGAQYIAWPLPFFTITYGAFDRDWNRDLLTALIVSVFTYLVEYGLTADLGQLLVVITHWPALERISDILNDDGPKTLLRLPLFATYAWLVFGGVKRLKTINATVASSAIPQEVL